jgi:hypothetical protein
MRKPTTIEVYSQSGEIELITIILAVLVALLIIAVIGIGRELIRYAKIPTVQKRCECGKPYDAVVES